MPLKLLVRAENSPTFPEPGSWAQGDIVAVVSDTHVFGGKETLPLFIRVRISNANTADLGWLQAGDGGEAINRRSSRMDPAEVEAVKATWAGVEGPAPTEAHVSFTRAQFNSRVVTRITS